MATLFQMAPEVRFLCELLENEEIDMQIFEDSLKSLELDKKIEGCVFIQRQIESDFEAFKKEKERIEKRMQIMKNNIEKVKKNLLNFMNIVGYKNLKVSTFRLRMGVSYKTVIVDEEKIPSEFLVEQKPKLNLIEIKKRLKNGEKIEGAELSKKEFVTIS